ncbi:hypothetical protein DVDV_0118 [Desulfovibrio sp. DV]|nr:hypothetical protein DVDV_0118 [Desulfovibrio sp. DV]
MVSARHRLYYSLRATEAGEFPPDNLVGTDPAWSDRGATNAYKMFDEYINTATSVDDLMDVTTSASRCDSVGVFGARGKTLTLDLMMGDVVIWSKTWTLLKPTYTYTEYCFTTPEFIRDIFTPIPIRGGSRLRIRIDAGEGGTAQCGKVEMGQAVYLGETQWDVTPSRLSFSKVTTNDFGDVSMSKGKTAKYLKFKATFDTSQIDHIQKRLDDIDGLACMFVAYGETGFQPEALLVYGFAKEVNPNLPNGEKSTIQFEVQGLI